MDFVKLGNRIRNERLNLGLTQEQLAEKINISKNFMSLIENGKNMSLETVVKLANTFGVSVDYLLQDIVTPQQDTSLSQCAALLNQLTPKDRIFILNFIRQYIEVTSKED